MHDILKELAILKGWIFDYGRSDYHNLFDETEQKPIPGLFLDPVEVVKSWNDSGSLDSITYSGSFVFALSSDIDETSYEYRYENYIKPILNEHLDFIEQDLLCSQEAEIKIWKTTEVINVFDYNWDGVIVTYAITIIE